MIYSIPYVILFLVLMALAVLNGYVLKIQRKWVVLSAYIILFLFFGFRGYICGDWQVYYPFFNDIQISDLSFECYLGTTEEKVFEPGFSFLALACKAIWNNFVFFQVACSIINIVLLHFFLKRTVKNENLGIAIFLLFGGFIMMTDLMRNSMAILLLSNGILYIEKREPLKFFSLCVLAGLFHASALICLPLYWLLRIRPGKWGFLIMALAANAIFIFRIEWFTTLLNVFFGDISSLITNKASTYVRNYEYTSVLSIGFLERAATTLVLFLCYDKLLKRNRSLTIYLNMYSAYLIVLMGLWENAVIAERLSYLMMPSYWVLWPVLVSLIKGKDSRKAVYAFIFLYGAIKMASLTGHPTNQYDNHLIGAKSYEERLILYRSE